MASDSHPDSGDDTVDGSAAPGKSVAEVPETIGRYRVERLLGRGGFGIVYLARDEQLRRPVAIKVAHPKLISRPRDAAFYLNEARIVAGLDHPNIVPVHDVGSTEEIPFYSVSKYIDGTDLSVKLRSGRTHWAHAADLIRTIAEALHFAHKQGLVHRDVKPANILLDREGKPYLVDFGLALREAASSDDVTYVGTPTYTSPEQSRGEGHRVDGRSDVFSLGVVFYEMLTGRRPFKGSSRSEVLRRVASYEPRPPRQIDERIPKELERVCQKAMAKLASERYSSAHDMAEDIGHFLESQQTSETVVLSDRQITKTEVSDTVAESSSPTSGTDSQPSSSLQQTPESSRHSALRIVPKGIRSFDVHDADFFLQLVPGPRDRDGLPEIVRFWKTRIEQVDSEQTFAAGLIYGPSGCGKSSLVNAGLLPRLSSHVISVFVEAAPGHTEIRLRRAIQRKCPTLPSDISLTETIKSIRQGFGPASDKKVLIVIDQFEQWLHTSQPDQHCELVEALRQCDGGRVQCIVMVRDDFWMAVTQFMRRLEVRISEGQNSAAVDTFPETHAVRVLTAFGRAFGALPQDSEPLDADQKAFLKQAVEGLSNDGKVICVRLALFAETMRTKAWTTKLLQEVGGAQGVGRSFLEETFDSSTAPPENRYHQRAARRVLQELLPDSGTNIRQSTCTYDQLRDASGYKDDRDFDELLEILNSEVRLITPTDPEGFDQDLESPADGDQRYFQLTHDYLVHSLRDWLTLKQKETRRGRAELLLRERAALYGAKRDSRFLPSLAETARIRFFTDSQRWTEEERAVVRRATRVHLGRGFAVICVALLVLTGLLGALRHQRRVAELARAETMVDGLAGVEISRVRQVVQRSEYSRELADPMLLSRLADSQTSDADKLRYALALGNESSAQEFLQQQLLTLPVDEFPVVRDAIVPSTSFTNWLWSIVQDDQDDLLRFQSCCALATYGANDPLWRGSTADFAAHYLTANVPPHEFATRIHQLSGAGPFLVPPLRDRLAKRAAAEGSVRERAAVVLSEFLRGEPEQIVGAILLADHKDQFRPLTESLLPDFEQAEESLIDVLREDPSAGELPQGNQARLRRRAIAAATLTHFGKYDAVLPLLVASDDSSLRSYIAHYFGEIPIQTERIMELASADGFDPSVLRMLIQGLGGLDVTLIASQRRVALENWMTGLHRTHPDPGVHGMCAWALRQWGMDPDVSVTLLTNKDPQVVKAVNEVDRLTKLISMDRKSTPEQAEWEKELADQRDATLDPEWDLRVRLKFDPQKILKLSGSEASQSIQVDSKQDFTPCIFGDALYFQKDNSLDCGDLANLDGTQPFSVGCWFNNGGKRDYAGLITRMSTAGRVNRGFDLWQNEGRVGIHLVSHEDLDKQVGNDFIKVLTSRDLAVGRWHHVMATYDGSMKASGVRLYVNGDLVPTETKSDTLTKTIETSAPLMMGSRYEAYPFTGWIDDGRIYDRELTAEECAHVFESGVRKLVRIPVADRSRDQQNVISRAYSKSTDNELEKDLRTARQRLDRLLWRDRRWVVNSQHQTMVLVPAQPDRGVPQDFAISAYEVTVKQWRQAPEEVESGLFVDRTTAPRDDCPMHNMNWYEAARYCNWLSAQEGMDETQWVYTNGGTQIKEGFQSLRGYRLPTHDEWMHACRAGSMQVYCFGTLDEIAGNYAWYLGNASGESHPVGTKLPNDLGLFDMHGNSWEWSLSTKDHGVLLVNDSLAKQSIVGGSFKSVLHNVQVYGETSDEPNRRSNYHSFRVVRSLPR